MNTYRSEFTKVKGYNYVAKRYNNILTSLARSYSSLFKSGFSRIKNILPNSPTLVKASDWLNIQHTSCLNLFKKRRILTSYTSLQAVTSLASRQSFSYPLQTNKHDFRKDFNLLILPHHRHIR